jgi:NTE family protein
VGGALVLAGGGVAGVAWELGVLRGVADADAGLAARIAVADLIVGTSAGSVVAAQISSGAALELLYEAQLRTDTADLHVDVDLERLLADWAAATAGAASGEEVRRRIGALALAADTVAEPVRRAVIADRLVGVPGWPRQRILLPAVDAATGRVMVFSREHGVDLIDAVAASCAVPGVWPPVSIDGRRYIDGGVRSVTNADLAAGSDPVLVIQPLPADAPSPWGNLQEELAALEPAEVYVVSADEQSLAAFGTNPLAPATRAPSARAGRAVGRRHAAALAAFWQPRPPDPPDTAAGSAR